MREEKERVLSENIWFPSSKGPFPGLERPLWQTCVMPSERGAHLHQPQRGRSRNPGATWGPCWPSPKQRNAWPQGGHFWCWQPFQASRRPFLMMTTISRGKMRIWCTHKNMLMYYLRPKFPKSPESECHKSDPLQKIISCLRVNEIDPTEVSAL